MTKRNPLNDADYYYEDKQIDDLKDTVHALICDVEYLLIRAHKHLVDPDRINEIKHRIIHLNTES
jgi:hypothetical protein